MPSPTSPRLRRRFIRAAFAAASRLAPTRTGHYLAGRFITPSPPGRLKAKAALAWADDVASTTLAIEGEQIVVYTWGDVSRQPFVLLGHGWSSYAMRFAPWVARLRHMGFAVLAFDQPGHGLSSGTESSLVHFVNAMRQIGRLYGRPAAFIGHSLGAAAAPLAIEAAWSPACFVLIAPLARLRGNVARMFRTLGVSSRVHAPFENWLFGRFGERLADFEPHAAMRRMNRPALVIHDRNDRETPWEDGKLVSELWPGARLLTTEGLGHRKILNDSYVVSQALDYIRHVNDRHA